MVKTSEDNIIDQLLLDLQKMSTQNTRQSSQAEVSVDHQELASIEYNINPSKHSQNNEPDAEPPSLPPPASPPPPLPSTFLVFSFFSLQLIYRRSLEFRFDFFLSSQNK